MPLLELAEDEMESVQFAVEFGVARSDVAVQEAEVLEEADGVEGFVLGMERREKLNGELHT